MEVAVAQRVNAVATNCVSHCKHFSKLVEQKILFLV